MATQPQPTDDNSTEDETHSEPEGLPAPEHVSDEQTAVPSLKGESTQRKNAVRIRLPQDEDKREELPEDIHGVLVWVLSDVCSNSNIDTVEILMYPGRFGFEFVLVPYVKNLDGRSDTQSRLDDFEDKLYRPGLSKLKQAVKRRYPETITAETGTLNLAPVGIRDVTTSRLHFRKDSNVAHTGNLQSKPLEVLFDSLREGHDPFIYQVIAEKSKGRFNIVVRLATYHPKDNYVGERGFAQLVTEGKPNDPANVFAHSNVLSSHDAEMASKYWNVTYGRNVDGSVTYNATYDYSTVTQYTTRAAVRKKAKKVREIVLGKEEHRRLLRGDTTTDFICEDEFNRYGRIPLYESQLKPFVRTYTKQWRTDPWKAVDGRAAPRFNSLEPINVETPAEFGIGEGMQDSPSDEKTVQNEGEPPHGSLENFSERIFTEGGDEIDKVQQDTRSIPDLRIETDNGEIQTLGMQVDCAVVPVEAESTNESKASNTLINAERAYAADRHVIFVYEQKDVKTGYKHLAQPHKGTLDDGVQLYTQSEPVRSFDGRYLVRQELSSTTWILKGSTLIAKDGEETIATGPATENVATFDWDCYYFSESDDSYRVETADGDIITEYGSKEAFNADWTRIAKPHVPVAPSYLDFVTVTYRDKETGQLKVYDPRPDWESNDDTESKKAGYKQFYTDHVVQRDGAELTYDDLDEAFTTWFEGHSQFDAPMRSVFAGWHPDEFKDALTGATGNAYRYFDGFDLRIEPGIDSPHQPGSPADLDADETTAEQPGTDSDENV